jgi:hypothetical protein
LCIKGIFKMEFTIGENNLQKCQECEKSIPKDVQRISFSYKTRYGRSYIRICALCIIDLAKKVNKATIKKYATIQNAKENIEKGL